MQLDGKTIIVTGAGSGIGRAAAQLVVERGGRVVAIDVDEEGLAATAESCDVAARVVGSVAEVDTWDRAVAATGGGLDGAYLNAGLFGFSGPIDEYPLDRYQAVIDANITGVVLGTRQCVPLMRSRGGSIVATASVAGIVAFEGNPVYTLTKQAVTGFVRSIASSLRPDGITINAVCPGVVDTPMTAGALGDVRLAERPIEFITPRRIAETACDLLVTDRTGLCRAVRERGEPVDWHFPDWGDLARA